ncbi:MAG: hypothetical protein H0W58_01530 [Acidobacteria bacterium]|jgi:hypothetical protein|nr:hypothetical protein [Acidobacteriota bacterium]
MENYELRITNYGLRIAKILCLLCVLCGSFFSVKAQSTNQNFPTPITTNEINGKIPARDVGDSRLTRYFYVFGGNQGDVFLNIQTSNFNGDIDVFTADNLKPITKITIYADVSETETGRVIYLRKPEKLILRVEGRSPNDDAAAFRIKFAGSFISLQANAENDAPDSPVVKTENQGDVRVNSVGTIIEVKPKPIPQPKETIAEKESKPKKKKSETVDEVKEQADEKEVSPDKVSVKNEEESKKINESAEGKDIVITVTEDKKDQSTENKSETEMEKEATKITIEKSDETVEGKTSENEKMSAEEKPENKKVTTAKSKSSKESKKAKELSALENVHLIVLFKNGDKIDRPMSEVIRVRVDKGILIIVTKEGNIGRYSILDVEKMTIQ